MVAKAVFVVRILRDVEFPEKLVMWSKQVLKKHYSPCERNFQNFRESNFFSFKMGTRCVEGDLYGAWLNCLGKSILEQKFDLQFEEYAKEVS